MKTTIKSIVVYIFLIYGVTLGSLYAQQYYPVVAKFTQLPPYPIYLADFSNPAQTSLSIQIQLRDNDLTSRSVRLRLYIEGQGLNTSSTDIVQGEPAIVLTPNLIYDIPQAQVANYFQQYNLKISPQQYQVPFKEGTFRFGIQVLDALTNRPISGIQWGIPVWIMVNEPPVWVQPQNNVFIEPNNPQNINFQWSPRHKFVNDVEYEFTITELNIGPNFKGNLQNIFLAQPPYYQTTTSSTVLNYNATMPPLVSGKIYGYRVQAKSKNGISNIGLFRNNGFSEIQTFRYEELIKPVYNLQAVRKNDNTIQLSWKGYENHTSYTIKRREKGQSNWAEETLPAKFPVQKVTQTQVVKRVGFFKKQTITLPKIVYVIQNLESRTYEDMDLGKYEFMVVTKGNVGLEDLPSDMLSYKDTMAAPILTPVYRPEDKVNVADLRWSGHSLSKEFQVEYRYYNEPEWRKTPKTSTAEYAKKDGLFSLELPGIQFDSTFYFRVVAFDDDQERLTSNEQILVRSEFDEPLVIIKERRYTGTVLWNFEKNETKTDNQQQTTWLDSPTNKLDSVHNYNEVSRSGAHILENAKVEIFANAEKTILIKTMFTSAEGKFDIPFPVEALRGGQITDSLYIRLSHPQMISKTFAEPAKGFEGSREVGNFVLRAKTYRLKFVLDSDFKGSNALFNNPNVIELYRRVSEVNPSTESVLKYESFENNFFEAVKINNEDYYKVSETLAGQTLGGVFYDMVGTGQELLVKLTPQGGRHFPYIGKVRTVERNEVYLNTAVISLEKAVPYVYGRVISGDSSIHEPLNLEVYKNGELIATTITSPEGTYKVYLPDTEYSPNDYNPNFSGFEIKLLRGYQVLKSYSFALSYYQLGLEINFNLENLFKNLVVLKLVDSRNIPIKNPRIEVGGLSYSGVDGIVSFYADENSTSLCTLNIVGYNQQNFKIDITSNYPMSYNPNLSENYALLVQSDVDRYIRNKGFTSNSQIYLSNVITSGFNYFKIDKYKYAGLFLETVQLVMQKKPFVLTFNVIDKNTNEGLAGVSIVEDGEPYNLIGKTDAQGVLIYTSTIDRGSQTYRIEPPKTLMVNGEQYRSEQISYIYPDINSNKTQDNISVALESGSFITGVVREKGMPNVLANATVTFRLPGFEQTVTTDAQGRYTLRFKGTEKEEFLEITANKKDYLQSRVYVAVAIAYGSVYQRDVFLEKASFQKEGNDVLSISSYILNADKLYGFQVVSIENYIFENKSYDPKTFYNVFANSFIAFGGKGPYKKDFTKDYEIRTHGKIKDLNNNIYYYTANLIITWNCYVTSPTRYNPDGSATVQAHVSKVLDKEILLGPVVDQITIINNEQQ